MAIGQESKLPVRNMNNEKIVRYSNNLQKNVYQTGREVSISFNGSMLEAGWFSNKVEACTLNLGKSSGEIRIYNGIDAKISRRKFRVTEID